MFFMNALMEFNDFINFLAIRMWHQWQDHKDYIGNSWSFTDEIATFIVLVNLVGQCTGMWFICVGGLIVTVKIDDIVKVNVDITNAGQGTNQSTFLTLGNNKKRK